MRENKTETKHRTRKVQGHTLTASGYPGQWMLGDYVATNYDHDGSMWTVESRSGGLDGRTTTASQTFKVFASLKSAVRWIAAQEVAA